MHELVFIKENKALTTSLIVAEAFGKAHKRVLQDIKDLTCSDYFREHNFVPSTYVSAQNKEMPMVYMNRKGFTLLAMGYTGPTAMKFKENYINQFEEMEKKINEPKVLSEKEQLLASMKLTLEASKELSAVKKDVDYLKEAVNERMTIDYGQQQVLLRTKNVRVEKLWKQNPHLQVTLTKKKLHASVWRDLKDAFNVASYRDIRESDFEEALNYLKAWRPRTTWLEMKA